MLHTRKWWFGFIASVLLTLWLLTLWILFVGSESYAYIPLYSTAFYPISEGEGYLLLFLTAALIFLWTMVMVLLVLFKRTRAISFGMFIPMLIVHAVAFHTFIPDWTGVDHTLFLLFIPSTLAFLTVVIFALTSHRQGGEKHNETGPGVAHHESSR